ncbi:MAG: RnfABCDGE type electron transport complex subunit D [Treponema sp.]|nr:RnfABCDGE type electron transport complex subunit D [Treponema sp.]
MLDRNLPPGQKPQINLSRSTTGRMWLVFCCAGLGVLQSALSDGGASLMVALTALCSAIPAEFIFTWRKNGFAKIKDGSAAASAMVLALLLPNRIHPLYAALGALFAMVVVKYSFGGLGSNWLNPSLGGWLFVRFSWPGVFNKALEGASSGIVTPSGEAVVSALDGKVTAFFNSTVFRVTGAELPSGYIDLMFPETPGIIADRGLLALFLGVILITAFRVGRSWAPAVFLAVFAILVRFAGAVDALPWEGDVLYALCSGGVIVTAFILAVEPVSGAKSGAGVLFTMVLAAILSWIFRYKAFELYGGFLAIALVNAFTPVIRLLEGQLLYSRKKRMKEAIARDLA